KVAEPSFELIAIDDRAQVVSSDRLVGWEQPQIRRPAPLLPALAVAGTNEEPVRPSLGAGGVAKLREVLPDGHQRLLRRVLGEVEVAQDPARHGEVPIGDLGGDTGVCRLVATLGSDHEIGIHAPSAWWRRSCAVPLTRYGSGVVRFLSIAVDGGRPRALGTSHVPTDG